MLTLAIDGENPLSSLASTASRELRPPLAAAEAGAVSIAADPASRRHGLMCQIFETNLKAKAGEAFYIKRANGGFKLMKGSSQRGNFESKQAVTLLPSRRGPLKKPSVLPSKLPSESGARCRKVLGKPKHKQTTQQDEDAAYAQTRISGQHHHHHLL